MCKPIAPRPVPIDVNTLLYAAAAPLSAVPVKVTRKRVSFHDKVDVYVIGRLDPFAIRDLFYRPADFRRFRSESCLEVLEANAGGKAPLAAAIQAILGVCITVSGASQAKQLLPTNLATNRRPQQRKCQISAPQCISTMQASPRRLSPESLLRELAFAV